MQLGCNALTQLLFMHKCFGTTTELLVQDASAFAEEGEQLSFWQIQVCSILSNARLQQLPYNCWKILLATFLQVQEGLSLIGSE